MRGDASATIKAFPQLFEGRSRVDARLSHLVQHLMVAEPCKCCRPTHGPAPLLNHLQSLRRPPLTNSLVEEPPYNLGPLSPLILLDLLDGSQKIIRYPSRENFQSYHLRD